MSWAALQQELSSGCPLLLLSVLLLLLLLQRLLLLMLWLLEGLLAMLLQGLVWSALSFSSPKAHAEISPSLLFLLGWLPCFGWDLSVSVAAVVDAAPHENWFLSTPRQLWIETMAQPPVATCSQNRLRTRLAEGFR